MTNEKSHWAGGLPYNARIRLRAAVCRSMAKRDDAAAADGVGVDLSGQWNFRVPHPKHPKP
jgi:hypothetical protein